MPRLPRRLGARFVSLVRADPSGVRAGLVALLISAATGLVAGLVLGSITGTLAELPGLLILVPAAVGMRGNVFGALGSRMGTAARTGTMRLSLRIDTLVGQNVASAVALSMALALVLAVVAKVFALAFGVERSIPLADFVVVSVIGGLIPIAVVLGITLALAELSVRRSWDLDDVVAPVVTAAADSVTLPSLVLATALTRRGVVTPALAIACAVVSGCALVWGLRSRLGMLRRIVRESMPVLVVSGVVSMLAGVALESRIAPLLAWPLLLVVVPPLLSLSGSLAGILGSRLATKLHLGLVDVRRVRVRALAEDLVLVYLLSAIVFTVLALAAEVLSGALGLAGPSVADVVGVVLLAGMLATTLSNVVAVAGSVLTYRLGLDPDNFAIPLVSSTSDLLGAASLMLFVVILGLG